MARAHDAGVSIARAVAARVLVRVWEESAFASAALDAELARAEPIEPRDAALATELVYGVLRTEGFLDERLAALSSRKKRLIDALPRAHLLIGAYAIAFLDRVPTFAAVSEAVTGVGASADARVAGYANAVLRRLAEEIAGKRPSLTDAIAASAPGWLRGSLRRTLGRAGAAAYLTAGPVPPPTALCLARGEERSAWIERLTQAAPTAEFREGLVSPNAIIVRGAGDLRRLPGFEREWIVQEEGSQLIALAVGARAGERVLDACAGRGNKTWTLASSVGEDGAVDAADLYPAKLGEIERRGIVRATHPVDWSVGSGAVPDGYDRVLVDAPCSGIGTLRRRPEIGARRTAEDVARLAELASAIARRAATRLSDGGRLLFAVCSVLREEGEETVARIVETPLESGTRLEAARFDEGPARALAGDETTLRLLPHVHGTDGYFLASFVARAGSA
jgi:16S rRNA (cytosine967-C5)-methyltransferase